MARIYLATEENQKTIINNQNTIKQNQSTIKTDQSTLKQDHVSMKKNQDEMLKLLKQGGDEEVSTMAAAWIQGINAHIPSWIVSTGKIGQVLNKLGGGSYSAINNCTTVKQVLDNAATWQQMVKNNLIVYCIEQSDDFMKTLVDYPERLYELVSNEYMQKLMRKSARVCASQEDTSDLGAYILLKYEDNNGCDGDIKCTYKDATQETITIRRSYTGKKKVDLLYKYLSNKKVISRIEVIASRRVVITFYDITKQTI